MSALDTQTKLGMSLDDLTQRRTLQSKLADRRVGRRPMPYSGAFLGGGRGAASSFRGYEVCNNCKRPGHYARECPNAAVCNHCGLAGHVAATCSNEPQCRNCKQRGHLAADCPNEAVCNICSRPGHIARTCPTQVGVGDRANLCNNCLQPGHFAASCPNLRACNNCHVAGHLARDCTNQPVCNSCQQPGHKAFECPNAMGGGARAFAAGPSDACFNCKKFGHIAKNCTFPKVCNNCGGVGHIASECPSDPRDVRFRGR